MFYFAFFFSKSVFIKNFNDHTKAYGGIKSKFNLFFPELTAKNREIQFSVRLTFHVFSQHTGPGTQGGWRIDIIPASATRRHATHVQYQGSVPRRWVAAGCCGTHPRLGTQAGLPRGRDV